MVKGLNTEVQEQPSPPWLNLHVLASYNRKSRYSADIRWVLGRTAGWDVLGLGGLQKLACSCPKLSAEP